MTTQEKITRTIRYINGFVEQLRETLPDLPEEQATLATVCATGALLGEIFRVEQSEATEAFGAQIALAIREAVHGAYHPGKAFAVVTDDSKSG